MTNAVRAPLFRFWLGLWVVFFVIVFLLTSLGFWKDLRDVGLHQALAATVFFGALFLTGFLSWAVVYQWKGARMTLPLAVEASVPLFTSAAARMKYAVERLDTGELVLRRTRSIAGVHPTIVVRPLSADRLRLDGPSGQIVRLSGFLVGRRQSVDWEPTMWDVVFGALLGAALLVLPVLLLSGVEDCASLDLPSSFQYRAMGQGMRRLCERWGPVPPAAIEVLTALIPLGYALGAWRVYRRRKQARPEAPDQTR
jgi:hypothetical protein